MADLKQSTVRNRMFKMISSADHISLKTGAAPVVNLSKNGGAFGAAGGAVSEIANGWYQVALTTTDTNTLGDLAFYITGSGADDTDFCDQVVANILGDTLPTNVTQWNGANVAAPATAGVPDVNVKNMNNVAATSITTINANQGTTQPLNFTGSAGSALVKVDVTDIATAAVSATTAQLGVNVVNWNNTVVATPATAGIPDINVKNINNVAAATPGASGGILISGSNSGTTTLGALTVTGATTHTGAVTMAAGLAITQSTLNGNGISVTGNGTGDGIAATGGATGRGLHLVGGGTSGAALRAETTSGDGFEILPTAGNGITATANGTSKHGIVSTGGTAGTSDGVKCVAGTGGVDLRANLTGSVTGNLSGSVGSVTGAVGSVTGAVGSVTGNVGGNVVGSVGSVTAGVTVTTNNDKTGYSLTQAFPTNFASTAIDANGNVKIQANVKKNTALTKFPIIMTDSTNHNPATGKVVTVTRSIDGAAFAAGTLSAVTELSNGEYFFDFGAGDLNGNCIMVRATAAGCDDTFVSVVTSP